MEEKELERIRDYWQPYYEEKLTLQDADGIQRRINIFFQLLAEVEMEKDCLETDRSLICT